MPFACDYEDALDAYEDALDAYERAERIEAARRDPNSFVEYTVIGDGGAPIVQEPGHRELDGIAEALE